MSNEEEKLEGQRRAVREHKDKYERYTEDHEKRFALKTIENAQQQIRDIKRRGNFRDSWEDDWRP